MQKPIIFSRHAEHKLLLLHRHGFDFSKKEIEEAVKHSTRVYAGYLERKIVECMISERHVLRIVFEDLPRQFKIITMYPARRGRYEN